ncbi:MAG: DUF6368 family protein [Verrucomicrobiota bacterium]
MAGPTVRILVRQKLDDQIKKIILALIHKAADKVIDDDFWINGCPLIYGFGPGYPEELDEYSGINERLGWKPGDVIGLCAMCNGEEDHQELGRITLTIAKTVHGKIAFTDSLAKYTSDRTIIDSDDVIEFGSESIIGVDAFSEWLKHPDFRMVK